MSRSYKRKNYEQEAPRWAGSKTAGFYTERDYSFIFFPVYRLPTKEEAFHTFKTVHGERKLWNNFKKDERRIVEKQYRLREKRKVIDFLKGNTEAIISECLPKYPSWWW